MPPGTVYQRASSTLAGPHLPVFAKPQLSRTSPFAFLEGACSHSPILYFRFLKNISAGHLRVLTYTHIYDFPPITQAEYDNLDDRVELRVVNDAFWVRLLALGDLGFSESYMAGDVECDDLVALFRVSLSFQWQCPNLDAFVSQIFLQNRDRLSNFDSKLSYVFSIPQKLTSYRFLNTIGNSRSNISAHYDLSNDMFAGKSTL